MYVEGVESAYRTPQYTALLLMSKVYPLNYTVYPNTKSSNYNKIRLKVLNYFELETL